METTCQRKKSLIEWFHENHARQFVFYDTECSILTSKKNGPFPSFCTWDAEDVSLCCRGRLDTHSGADMSSNRQPVLQKSPRASGIPWTKPSLRQRPNGHSCRDRGRLHVSSVNRRYVLRRRAGRGQKPGVASQVLLGIGTI